MERCGSEPRGWETKEEADKSSSGNETLTRLVAVASLRANDALLIIPQRSSVSGQDHKYWTW